MGILGIIATAFALSMDAFAVSICNGLSSHKCTNKDALLTGLFFGGAQGLMPIIGFYIGKQFEIYISSLDHWIVFAILLIIGANMIRESRSCNMKRNSFTFKNLFFLAIATSIDALAVGVSFAFIQVKIFLAAILISFITMTLSIIGVKIGNNLGLKFKTWSAIIGGLILILLGTKILFEHLGFINF